MNFLPAGAELFERVTIRPFDTDPTAILKVLSAYRFVEIVLIREAWIGISSYQDGDSKGGFMNNLRNVVDASARAGKVRDLILERLPLSESRIVVLPAKIYANGCTELVEVQIYRSQQSLLRPAGVGNGPAVVAPPRVPGVSGLDQGASVQVDALERKLEVELTLEFRSAKGEKQSIGPKLLPELKVAIGVASDGSPELSDLDLKLIKQKLLKLTLIDFKSVVSVRVEAAASASAKFSIGDQGKIEAKLKAKLQAELIAELQMPLLPEGKMELSFGLTVDVAGKPAPALGLGFEF